MLRESANSCAERISLSVEVECLREMVQVVAAVIRRVTVFTNASDSALILYSNHGGRRMPLLAVACLLPADR